MPIRRFLIMALLVCGLWVAGITGYMFLEDWDFMDAVYMTAISLTTVGYGEVRPLSETGRIFTTLLITTGVGFFFYAFTIISEAVIEGHLKGLIKRRRMEKNISRLSGHYIVCGYGRLGRVICKEILSRSEKLVVIELSETVASELDAKNIPYVLGDATKDDVLLKAGLRRSKGLITVLDTDAANMYITISARSLCSEAFIVARAEDENAELKMLRAGADKVISPYKIGAVRMALAALEPALTEFLDLTAHEVGLDLEIEQLKIEKGSEIDGKTIKDAAIRARTGVTILALKKNDQKLKLQIEPDERLEAGDIIIVLGDSKGMEKARRLVGYKG